MDASEAVLKHRGAKGRGEVAWNSPEKHAGVEEDGGADATGTGARRWGARSVGNLIGDAHELRNGEAALVTQLERGMRG